MIIFLGWWWRWWRCCVIFIFSLKLFFVEQIFTLKSIYFTWQSVGACYGIFLTFFFVNKIYYVFWQLLNLSFVLLTTRVSVLFYNIILKEFFIFWLGWFLNCFFCYVSLLFFVFLRKYIYSNFTWKTIETMWECQSGITM